MDLPGVAGDAVRRIQQLAAGRRRRRLGRRGGQRTGDQAGKQGPLDCSHRISELECGPQREAHACRPTAAGGPLRLHPDCNSRLAVNVRCCAMRQRGRIRVPARPARQAGRSDAEQGPARRPSDNAGLLTWRLRSSSWPHAVTTELLFRADAYLRTASARVVAVHEHGIELDRTIFYPTGGGQQGDTGVLLRAERRADCHSRHAKGRDSRQRSAHRRPRDPATGDRGNADARNRLATALCADAAAHRVARHVLRGGGAGHRRQHRPGRRRASISTST